MDYNKVYIHKTMEKQYPSKKDCFSPSICYPEYIFKYDVSKSDNKIYDIIRECLYNMGFDKEHFGTKYWNPLREIIQPGNVVVLKPNMVLHENEIPENGTDCLITHPSLVRAMLDYVVLALDNSGTIIVGDAPLQSCNFEKLIEEQGYLNIIDFYRNRGIKIDIVDFRNYKTIEERGIHQRIHSNPTNSGVKVDLGDKSEFVSIDCTRFKRLRVTNYDHSIMYVHHNCGKNEYSISKIVLDADVIINMPKPKTHRKAGVTISLKNLIGINTNKEWLPHHSEGSIEEGGDEYQTKNLFKKARTYFTETKDDYMVKGMKHKARIYYNLARGTAKLANVLSRDRYSEGSWFGNDTIWRTILDLNKIIFYSDKQGNMRDTKQRKMLIVGDMIISGEEEGPLMPTPKNVGAIAIGMNPVCFDEAISAIMGFTPTLIPSIYNARNIKHYSFIEPNDTEILSNHPAYNLKKISQISYDDSFKYKPSYGWREHFHSTC